MKLLTGFVQKQEVEQLDHILYLHSEHGLMELHELKHLEIGHLLLQLHGKK